jgi:hypothetical protein
VCNLARKSRACHRFASLDTQSVHDVIRQQGLPDTGSLCTWIYFTSISVGGRYSNWHENGPYICHNIYANAGNKDFGFCKPLSWLRLMFGRLGLWHGKAKLLSFIHPAVKFTWEASDSLVHFLDVNTHLKDSIPGNYYWSLRQTDRHTPVPPSRFVSPRPH